MDVSFTRVKTKFERHMDKSLLLRGSISKLQAWDPDMSKTTSDRNRHVLSLTEEMKNNVAKEEKQHPFFTFQYRTFKPVCNRNDPLPQWVEGKIAGGIDDFLTIKMRPLEFLHVSERTAELADYLNNGLPGELFPSFFCLIVTKALILPYRSLR